MNAPATVGQVLADLSGGDLLLLVFVVLGCGAWIRLLLLGDSERELRRIERIFGRASEADRAPDRADGGSLDGESPTTESRAKAL